MSGLFCISRSDARKRDAGYEELEEQSRVREIRYSTNNKKAELGNLALLSIFCS